MTDGRQIEMKRLRDMAKSGKSAQEMMAALNIADMAALKQALEAAMRREGERVVVPGLTGEPALDARYTDEGIRISPQMLEGTAFRRGDAFKLKVEGDRIVMQKTGGGP